MGIGPMFPLLHPSVGSSIPLHSQCSAKTRPLLMLRPHLQGHRHPSPRGLAYLLTGQLMGHGQFCSTRWR